MNGRGRKKPAACGPTNQPKPGILSSARLWWVAVWLLVVVPAAESQIARLGAIGDSLTDEYSEQSYGDYSRAWTELLVEQRGVDMGPTAAEADQPGDWWGEPRRSGFEDNWARFGATTDDALAAGQHSGLADGVANRSVSHAVVFVGGNDFSPWAGAYDEVYDGSWGAVEIDAWLTGRIDNLRSLIEPSVAAGTLPVLASVFDFSAMPFVQAGFPDPAQRDRVTTALSDLADRVRDLASEQRLTLLDMFALGQAIFGTNSAPRGTLLVGNVPIDLTLAGDAANLDAGFVDDGIHPHTVLQGIWANCVMAALEATSTTGLTPFSEAEILAQAGLSYGGSDTLNGQIGDCADYVTDFSGLLFADGFESGNSSEWSGTEP